MNKKIYVVSGFSGVGKDTVLEKVAHIEKNVMQDRSKLWFSKSDTTRPTRNEADHYTFISKDEFLKRADAGYYLEMNTYETGELYGTPLMPIIDARGIVIIQVDVNGMLQIKRDSRLKDIPIITIFIGSDAETLLYRLQHRGDDEAEIRVRLGVAAEEAMHINEYDYMLVNEDVDETSVKLWSILSGIPVASDMFNESEFINNVSGLLALDNLPTVHKPFSKIIRYRCNYCKKEFVTNNKHRCKFNPFFMNCFSCMHSISINFVTPDGSVVDEGTKNCEKAFVCDLQDNMAVRSMRNLSEAHWCFNKPCEYYMEMADYDGKDSFLHHLLLERTKEDPAERFPEFIDYLLSLDIPVSFTD